MSLTMQRLIPIFLMSMLFLGSVQAKKYSLSKLLYERDKYQQNLQKELQSRIEAVVPKTHFILKTEVIPKIIYDRPKSVVQPDIFIGKLGMAAPIGPKKLKKSRIFRNTFRDNIRKIKVNVILDDTVVENKVTDIQQIVHNLVTLVHPSRLDFETNRMVIVGGKTEVLLQHKIDKVNNFLGNNRTLFFIFLGLVLICGLSLTFYQTVKKSTQSISRAGERILTFLERTHGGKVSNVDSTSEESYRVEERESKDLESVQKELAYFIKCSNERPIRLSLLVNQWIHDKPSFYEDGVALLPHLVDHKAFGEIIGNLSEDTKKKLSNTIGKNFVDVNHNKGKEFLQSHLPFMFYPDKENSFEKAILSLTSEECVEVIKREPQIGALVMQSIPQEKSQEILGRLPESIMGLLIDSSLKTDVSEPIAERRLKELVGAIREERAASIPPTFLSHIISQLKDVSPEREKGIYKMFRDSGRTEVLYYISKEVFPSELILKLPSSIIKLVLSSFSLEFKARLVLSCPGLSNNPSEAQEKLKAMMCQEGSREERFLEMEIKKIEDSVILKTHTMEKAGETWREFAQAVRRYMQTNKQAEKDARKVLDKWIYEGDFQSEVVATIKKAA